MGVSKAVCIRLTNSDVYRGFCIFNERLICNPVQKDVRMGTMPNERDKIPLHNVELNATGTLFC